MKSAVIAAIAMAIAVYAMERLLYYREGKSEESGRFLKLTSSQWLIVVAAGLATGVAYYFITTPPAGWEFLPTVLACAVSGAMIGVAYFWKEEGTEVGELMAFIGVEVILFFLALEGVKTAKAVPWMVLFGVLGYILYHYFMFRSRNVDPRANKPEKERKESSKRHKAIGDACALIAVALILLAFALGFNGLFSLCSSCAGVGKAADTAEPTGTAKNSEPTQEDLNNLTVRRLTAEDLEDIKLARFKDYSDVLLDSSLSAKDEARVKETGFSDALTFGFKTNDKFAELEEEILRNPVVAVTYAEAIKDEKIGNQTVGELNPWMKEMVELTNQHGISYWLEYRGDDGVVYVTPEFRRYAATLCVWLERLIETGDQTWTTAKNWCLNSAARDNDRRGIPAPYQYEGEFYTRSYIGKNGATLLIIGFNTKDKREATPEPEPGPSPTAPPTTAPPTTAKPTPTPEPTAKPTPPPTPETPTLPPPPTPSPTPETTKDPNSGSNPGGNEGPTANPGPTFYPSHAPETPTPGPTVTPVPEASMTPAVPGPTDGGPWTP